jgi:tetratricopeptide (TPR) repeat protein
MTLFSHWRFPPFRLALCGSLLLIACVSLSVVGPAAAQTPLTAKTILEPIVEEYGLKYQDVDTAIDQLKKGQISDARETLKAARQKNPELPPANIMLAQILFLTRQANLVRLGVATLEQAARDDPDDPGAYVYLGELALQSRRTTEAGLLYEKALELCNKYTANDKRKNRLLVNAYGGLATLAEANNDLEKSKQYLDSMLQIDAENTLGLMRYGRVIFKLATDRNGENEAYRIFQKLHRLKPNETAHPDVNMGLLYEQADKPGNAQRMMEQAIKKDGDNLRTRLAVAKWAMDTNNMALAKENADAAAKLDPESLEAMLYVGLVARFMNDLGTAEAAFAKAHQKNPNHLGALTQLCLALVDQPDAGKKERALDYARMNVKMNSNLNQPAGREAAVTLAWVFYNLKQSARAMQTIDQVLPVATSLSADSAYHAAKILYDNGRNETARKILESKLASDSVFPNRGDAEALLNSIRSP